MRLVTVWVEGYRSIRAPLQVAFDPRVTVLLGANDHGKTNLLEALRHLNPEAGFEEEDLNWDMAERADELPVLRYELRLEEDELRELARVDAGVRLVGAARNAQAEQAEVVADIGSELLDVENEHEEVRERGETAAAEARDAESARDAEPSNEELRTGAIEAASAVGSLERERGALGKRVERITASLQKARLGEAMALARLIEGEAMRDGEEVSMAVERRLGESEEVEGDWARSLKKATSKLKSAQGAMDDLPEDAEESLRSDAERALADAKKEVGDAAKRAEESELEASALRAAAAALQRRTEGESAARTADLKVKELTKSRPMPLTLVLARRGLKGTLSLERPEGGTEVEAEALDLFLGRWLPRVELVSPVEKLPDDVSLNGLSQDSSAFMRGIFRYAGLEPEEWKGIFSQDARTSMRLARASEELNATLRQSWSQGRELTFRLQHDSKRSRINLEIMDPAVQSTYTKPSRRSSGFTHFFALKTVLHALQNESPQNSYIWVFDEPGIHLHPDGQRDLMAVMETLSETNQVIYTTHSIFLANQNYPTRHRLVVRAQAGTVLDSKPFLSRWATALDALGLTLAGTVLFAPNVLLVEGDSDAIYITAILRKAIAAGSSTVDLNSFAAMATGSAASAAMLIRVLSEGGPGAARPKLAVLVDGDKGGKDRLRAIKKLTDEREIPTSELTKDTTMEDHLPGSPELYYRAVQDYLTDMVGISTAKAKHLKESFEERFASGELPKGLADWTRTEAVAIAGLDEKPSPVGIARAYAALLEVADLDPRDNARTRRLIEWISTSLTLPEQTIAQERILE